MKVAFLNLQNLTEAEVDVIFGLQLGADFMRVSVGSVGNTSSNQKVTVLGYTDLPMTGALSVEQLDKHRL